MSDLEALAVVRRALGYRGWAVAASTRTLNVALPEWFSPDVIAVKGDRTLVVEIKPVAQALAPGHFDRAEQLAAAHGREYQLFRLPDVLALAEEAEVGESGDEQDDSEPPLLELDIDEVDQRLIALCARAEAAMRWVLARDAEIERAREGRRARAWDLAAEASKADDVRTALGPAAMLGSLVELGFVASHEYKLMRDALVLRNAIVHGRDRSVAPGVPTEIPELQYWPETLIANAREIWARDQAD